MVTLTRIESKHQPFIEKLYRSTREPELNLTNWTEAQKDAFARMQLMAQLADYKSRYKGASYQLVLYRKKPVGRLYCWESADEVRVLDISILPEFRGQGLGGALLTDVIKAARRQKKPVTLHVYPDNPAKRLYERLGFRKVGDNQASEFMRLDHS